MVFSGKCWICTRLSFCSAFLSLKTKSTLDDSETREAWAKTLEWKRYPFCWVLECDLIDTVHLQRPPHALWKDICNRCQGPINHPVSKRPCNGFYISTYVESEHVCHRCEPLSEKMGHLEAFPTVMWTICAIDLRGFTCHWGIPLKWGEADAVIPLLL